MANVNPLLLVGAVIGVVTALLVLAYALVKDKKETMDFERTMNDGEILRRLAGYAKPYWAKFVVVLFLMLFSIAYDIISPLIIGALEEESLKYETYFKLIIATGMRRGECCGLQWGDINWDERSIHIQRNVVKVTGEDIIVKETKTVAGDRYVYFSLEMESLLKEFQRECAWETETYLSLIHI